MHIVYIKKIIAISSPWNSFQNHASGNTNTLPSHGTNNTEICSSFSPSHSICGWGCQTPQYITRHSTGNGGLCFHFHLIINIGINIYILLFLLFQIDNEDSIIWFSDTIIILDRNLSGILWFLKSCPLGVEEAAARWKKQSAAIR